MSHPEVTMIVVSWNVRDALRRCITAAFQSQDCKPHVIVIDNKSSDGSAEMVAQEFPQAQLIQNSENRGFAAAVNQGLAYRRGHVLLVNPDLELHPNTVATLLEWMHKLPRAGILGPRLQYADGQIQHSVKKFPRWRDVAWQLTKFPNIFPRLGRYYHAADFDYTKSQEVDQVMGSCFLIRDTVLENIPNFDEGFWIWFEEVDFCLRASRVGWRTFFAADAVATHGRGQSFKQLSTIRKQQYLRKSIGYYAQKHFGKVAYFGLMPFFFASWLGGLAIQAMHWNKPTGAKEF
jgi:N-acetylglucosaminyl-diphospho-decaprenol L-rhamnosyltransferase